MSTVDGDLLDRIRAHIVEHGAQPSPACVAEALRKEGHLVGDAAVLHVVDALRSETLGAGLLDPLLRLDGVTDVLVNGPTQVFVDTGPGLQLSAVRFPDDAAVRRLAQRLAASAGRRLDDASPYVDVRLRDGTRFHAVLAPLSRPGTCLSLRIPARRTMTMEDLVAAGSITEAGSALLLDIVRARLAFLVSGGTGTGKTTLLAALLSYVDPRDRLVIVEDASELHPRHPHTVSLEVRQANVEGAGAVPLRELVRQALRMRPDRLVVGEVRGAEDPRSSVTHAVGCLSDWDLERGSRQMGYGSAVIVSIAAIWRTFGTLGSRHGRASVSRLRYDRTVGLSPGVARALHSDEIPIDAALVRGLVGRAMPAYADAPVSRLAG